MLGGFHICIRLFYSYGVYMQGFYLLTLVTCCHFEIFCCLRKCNIVKRGMLDSPFSICTYIFYFTCSWQSNECTYFILQAVGNQMRSVFGSFNEAKRYWVPPRKM
uniref:Uncharacterized protein n=1 Tax=Arundo donax TaxID=35708 RepID=A0A0A9G3T8_ARUDO